MLKLGTKKIPALYVGGEKIVKGLVGTDVVFELVKPPAVYTISAALNLPGGGTVTGGGTYQEGEAVTLTYTAAEDYRFVGWYAGSTLLSKENPYTFTASQNMDITARCEEVPTYTLTLVPTGISAQNWTFSILVNGTGPSWSGAGAVEASPPPQKVTVKEGSVTVQATSPVGYEFAGWQIGSGSVAADNPYTFNISGDTTLYCLYEKASRLPAGYTELEYVQSSDTVGASAACMLIPTISGASGVYCKFSLSASIVTGSIPVMVFGYQNKAASNTTYMRALALMESNVVMYPNLRKSSNLVADPVVLGTQQLNTIYEFRSSVPEEKSSLNGKEVSSYIRQAFYTPTTSYKSFGLMGSVYEKAIDVNPVYIKGLRIYEFKLLNSSGEALLHLIPCADSTGAVGMYDIIGKVFYTGKKGAVQSGSSTNSTATNSTTYPLIAGPAV